MKKALLTVATFAISMVAVNASAKTVCDYDTGSQEVYTVIKNAQGKPQTLKIKYHVPGTPKSTDATITFNIVSSRKTYPEIVSQANLLLRGEGRELKSGNIYEIEVPRYPNQEVGIYKVNDGAMLVVRFDKRESSASDSAACLNK